MSPKSEETTTAEHADGSKQGKKGANRGHQSTTAVGAGTSGEATTSPHNKKSGHKKGKKGKKKRTKEGGEGEGSDGVKGKGKHIRPKASAISEEVAGSLTAMQHGIGGLR